MTPCPLSERKLGKEASGLTAEMARGDGEAAAWGAWVSLVSAESISALGFRPFEPFPRQCPGDLLITALQISPGKRPWARHAGQKLGAFWPPNLISRISV